MSFQKINAALVKAWQALACVEEGNTQYENVKFTPATNEIWARLTMIPAQPVPVTIGTPGTDEHVGLLQVDIFAPLDDSTGPTLQVADLIAECFFAGANFSHENQCVRITSCGRGRSAVEGGWYRTIITINWSARVPRRSE